MIGVKMTTRDQKTIVNERREIARLVAIAKQDGASNGYSGKRAEARTINALYLEVTSNPKKFEDAWGVTMHDISAGGISFWTRQPLPINNTIYIRECTEYNSRPWIVAHIRHRTRALQGQLIGAEFAVATQEEPAPWIKRSPTPFG
jgi:hypothetical protein